MKLVFTISVFFFSCIIATAQTFVHQGATGSNDGTTWTDAFTNLQDAIDAAVPESEIWIAAGTYLPEGPTPDSSHFLITKPIHLYGGFVGTETNLSQRDWNDNPTIVSGDLLGNDIIGNFSTNRVDNAHHVLIINSPNETSIIDGIVFQGGMTRVDAFAPNAMDVPYNRWRGGGLYIYRSGIIVRNCIFRDNYGTQGAGLFAGGDTTQSRSLILENSLFESNAGVIAGASWISGWNEAIIRDCVFRLNYSGSHSAAITLGNIHAVIEDCSFDKNTASGQGGASLLFTNDQSLIAHPTFQFNRCVFTENTAPTGGAIRFNNFASSFSLGFDSCSFEQNIATHAFGSGGAIYIQDNDDNNFNEVTSTIQIRDTRFSGNTATYGGAVEVDGTDDSLRIDVTHSVFLNNSATDSGGGLYLWMVDSSNVVTHIEQTEFNGNTAIVGGGLILHSYYNIKPMSYEIDSCQFSNNMATGYGGAIGQFLNDGPGLIGSIRKSQFINNQSTGPAGAIFSIKENLQIEDCLFLENDAESPYQDSVGAGAIFFIGPAEINIINSIFEKNNTNVEGAAVYSGAGVKGRYENVLFQGNEGLSTLVNQDTSKLFNTTMVNNTYGLFLLDGSAIEIQNSIFNNTNGNLRTEGTPEVISNGSNISSDATMTSFLTGNGNYEDIHNTDPLLGPDFVPLSGSPCIDAGNQQGIKYPFDLAGNPRVYGGAIDIGSYESFLVATQEALWNETAFLVYPNPVNDILHLILEMEAIGDLNLTLYSYTGQVVHRARLNKSDYKQSFSENLSHLSAGQYVALVVMNGNTYATNIIVQP